MREISEGQIRRFWSERPMLYRESSDIPGDGSEEDLFKDIEKIFRDKGRLFQKEGETLLGRFIDYASLNDKTVLDIGFGTGWLLNELAKAGARVHGIDLSDTHCRLSASRFHDHPAVHLQLASAEHIPYDNESFDFVSSWGVLHHAADDQACFDEVHRVLKPGGKALFMLYRRGGPNYWWKNLVRRGILFGGLFRHGFNVASFINSVTDAYQKDSPGAPISRHYDEREIIGILGKFSQVQLLISGNAGEWRNLPFNKLPLSNLLGDSILLRLVEFSGGYWIVSLVK